MEPLGPGDPPRIGGYWLTARLGSGGMGRVYLGRSAAGRSVAVKVIHDHFAHDRSFRARFAREVLTARAVSGAYTAPVIDADPEAATPWLVTEYLPGLSLQEAVDTLGPFPVSAAYALGAGLAEGLESIHRAGVVHRDLKPSNVLLSPEGPRVIDFGIARAAESAEITKTGSLVGSPAYMSPEQARGHEVGPPSDVFSFGAVLTFATTGTGAFGTGAVQVVMYRVMHKEPRLDGVPDPGLRALVAECLAKDPGDRPTAEELLGRLSDHATDLDGTGWLPAPLVSAIAASAAAAEGAAAPAAVPGKHSGPSRRLVLLLGAGGALLAAGGAAAGLVANARGAAAPKPTSTPLAVTERPGAAAPPAPRGRLVWRHHTSGVMTGEVTLAGGTVGVVDSRLLALDAASGRRRWAYGRAPDVHAAAGGLIYVQGDDALTALGAGDGRPRWSYPLRSILGFEVPPVVAGGTVHAVVRESSPRQGYRGGLRVLALDAATGALRWSREGATEPVAHRTLEPEPGLAVADGVVYVTDDELYAFGAGDGRPRWRYRASGAGRPIVHDGTVLVTGSDTNQLHAVRAGKRRWISDVKVTSRVAAAGKVVYGGDVDGKVYGIDVATGQRGWEAEVADDAVAAVAVSGDRLYVGSADKSLYVLDTATGRARWRYATAGRLDSTPVVRDGIVYVRSGTADLYALAAPR